MAIAMIIKNILSWFKTLNNIRNKNSLIYSGNVAIFFFSIILSIFCAGVLKERVEKLDELRVEYNRLETIFNDISKRSPTCIDKPSTDVTCKDFNDANSHLEQTLQQIRMIKNIENRGSPVNICGKISSIASGLPGFESECYKYDEDKENKSNNATDNNIPQSRVMYNDFKENFKYTYFDRLPSEILYIILVMASSIIGTIYKLKSELRKIFDLNINDIVSSLSQGFIAYIIVLGAKYFIVLGNQQIVTNINPYSIALVGCLSGMLFDSFFNMIPKDKKFGKGHHSTDDKQSV